MCIYIEGVSKKDAKKFPVMAEDSYVSATCNVGEKPETHEPPVSQRCKKDTGLLNISERRDAKLYSPTTLTKNTELFLHPCDGHSSLLSCLQDCKVK